MTCNNCCNHVAQTSGDQFARQEFFVIVYVDSIPQL